MTDYLLDSDSFLFLLKGNRGLQDKVTQVGYSPLAVSVIRVGEVLHGAYNSSDPVKSLTETRNLLGQFQVILLDATMADRFGTIRADLKKVGQIIADFDILIGTTAIVTNRTLVTNSQKHFNRLSAYSLIIENWKT